jgi:hypothetical protein
MTVFCLLSVIFCFLSCIGSASAATPSPGWRMDSVATPTNFLPATNNTRCLETVETGKLAAHFPVCDAYEVSAMNAGSKPTDGSPITLIDTLPEGVTVGETKLSVQRNPAIEQGFGQALTPECTTVGRLLTCTVSGVVVGPDDWLQMLVFVTVNEGASGPFTNAVQVSGGGAPSVSTESTNQIGSTPAPFGPSRFDFYKDGLNGSQDSQAGGHPYELTTTIDLNNELANEPAFGPGELVEGVPTGVEPVKDIVVDLPLGFAGSTLAAPQCTEAQLDTETHCPPETIVGHLNTEPLTGIGVNNPIYNIVPERGHPAEFGYVDVLNGAHIAGYVSVVPTPAGYVLRFVAPEIPEIPLNRIVVTFYGDPALRAGTSRAQVPFFTNPTACSNGPQVAKLWTDSWRHPARFQPGGLIPTDLQEPVWVKNESVAPPVTGCNALQFSPELGAQPTTHEADKPSGLEFEQRLPQTETVGVNATPALKDTVIQFPEGMTVDPSSANGLGTCTNAQIGWLGTAPAKPGELYDFTENPPECPESSKIGTLELETPLIPGVLHGEVFLAAQNANPFASTFATYIVVNDPITGVVLKLAGELKSDPVTGRLTAIFDETPQLPFSDLKVHFFGGPRAELATPPSCGTYTTNSELTPWSAPDSGPSGTPFDNYVINENCATGFAPSFAALTTNLQAGEYTPFEGSISREDNDQELAGLTMSLPPGLLANVPSVHQCGQAEIQAEENDSPGGGAGGCPQSSQVGTVLAEAGPGPNPLAVPGKIFFTGPHNNGPYGLAVVVSANPGPFHFGNVVVRQSLRIDPYDAHVTDVSDPFPTFIHPVGANGQTNGIPIKLRRVNFNINRPGFTFNPTSCNKLGVSGTISSTQGAVSNLAVPFQITNCQTLKFAPKFSVSTSGKTSKANGASLTAKVSYPNAPQGTYANIAKVKVELPKQLPSRLTTLQKACTNAQFNANPAACPSASKIGFATVHTPILPLPLTGPAIFVSHGDEAFPSLEMVLQGNGVTIDLVGATFIKNGVTSTTFKTVPDSPFSTFELTLPQGKFSALAANGNLCKLTTTKTVNKKVTVRINGHKKTVTRKVKQTVAGSLVMPNEFVAQNGAVIKQDSTVKVTGCPKPHKAKKASKGKSGKGKRRK